MPLLLPQPWYKTVFCFPITQLIFYKIEGLQVLDPYSFIGK
jgi:hypothetical protein